MEFEDFKKYVEENCRAKNIFLPKLTAYITDQVNSDENKVYLSPSQIEYEVKKAWNDTLRNLYTKVNKEITTKRTDPYPVKVEKWISGIRELEILDDFSDSIDEMEFD